MEKKRSVPQNEKCRAEVQAHPRVCICPKCGSQYQPGQLLCAVCGARTLEYVKEAETLGIAAVLDGALDSLGQTLAMTNTPDASWIYPEIHQQMLTMQKIQEIARHDPSKDKRINQQINRLAGYFLRRSQSSLMEIALVGTVKAGKSSLINAFIGSALASVDAVPETSVLTKYRTTADSNYLRVRFYTEADWKRIWQSASEAGTFLAEYERTGAEQVRGEYLGKRVKEVTCATLDQLRQEVMKWTKSDTPEHFFVKELEVGYKSNAFPHDVFFVDTPGLDDPVRYRSNITRRYISKSDWTLACITAESLSEKSELSFLSRVIANRNGETDQIFTIITKKDQLEPEDLAKKKSLFLQQSSQLYGDADLAARRTFEVCAIGHSLTMKYLSGVTLEKEEKRQLRKALVDLDYELGDIETYTDDILDYMGVRTLYAYLNTESVQQARSIIIQRILKDYQKCVQAISSLAKAHQEMDDEYMRNLVSSKEELEQQIRQAREAKQVLQEKQEQAARLSAELERHLASGKRGIR